MLCVKLELPYLPNIHNSLPKFLHNKWKHVTFTALILVAQTAICVNIHDAAIELATSFKQAVSLLALLITVNTVHTIIIKIIGLCVMPCSLTIITIFLEEHATSIFSSMFFLNIINDLLDTYLHSHQCEKLKS
jgi:hypothetical protein